MKKTWILLADARRGRCLERMEGDPALTELADFIHAQDRHAGPPPVGDVSGDAGKGHGRTGHSGTQFEPRTDLHTKERRDFARQLVKYLNDGVAAHRCTALVVIASGPMLGEIRPLLSHAAEKMLEHCVAGDLTSYQGPELRKRVDKALQSAT